MRHQRWTKRGLLFDPARSGAGWLKSHAALPVVDHLEGDLFRIYFSGRDERKRAQVGWFDVEWGAAPRIVRVSPAPVIAPGPLGSFDDSGTTSACLVRAGRRQFQYYSGWNLGVTVPFYFFIGLATSDDGGRTWQKHSAAPVLGRSAIDPYLTASPSVLVENGRWRMWYVSGSRWVMRGEQPQHDYHIRYAESADGIRWEPTGRICIDYADAAEHAIARPHVVHEHGRYRMWFCCRGSSYRLGYAESTDGLRWERCDAAAGLQPSDAGWDSEMVAYPAVFVHRGVHYMLYNGNGYGKTGIGYAVCE